MLVPNRYASSTAYRYGFQGQEKDDELKGEGNSINFTYRMHDPRVGRFFTVDPLTNEFPWNSPYAFSENKVINGVELEGLEFDNLKVDFGFKVLVSLESNMKVKSTLYTALTNNTHGFGVNIINNNGSLIVNVAYVPKIPYSVTANENRINLSGNIAGNPLNFTIKNPTNGLFITEKPLDDTVSNIGLGVGYNLFKKTISFGLTNQKLETSLVLPPSVFDGSFPTSSFSPVLPSSSVADISIQPLKIPFIGKLTMELGTPSISPYEREQKLRNQEKAETEEKRIKSPQEKELKTQMKSASKKEATAKAIAPVIKIIFELIKG